MLVPGPCKIDIDEMRLRLTEMAKRAAKSELNGSGIWTVSALISEWSATRPDLDTWPYRIYASASMLTRELTEALAPTFAEVGIKGGDYEVLSRIRRMGPPFEAAPTKLSHDIGLTTGAMTRRLDRVEAAGYLVRLPHGSDRRAIVARLTPAGVDVVDRTVELILERLAVILAPVRSRVAEFEDIVREIIDNISETSTDS